MSKQEIKAKIKEAIERDPLQSEIQKVSLFGSYLSGAPREDSDIDLIIEFVPTARIGFFSLIGIKHNMEDYVQKPIDLLTPDSISRFFRDEVINMAETIYEK